MPNTFTNRDGWPTNAVHGFTRFIIELLEQERPAHIAVAFDEALDSCFRNEIYPLYKANREPAPAELKRQFKYCKQVCSALGLQVLAHSDYEADDLIGSALHYARGAGLRGIILSADKDLSQLLDEHDEQWDYSRGLRWGRDGVKGRYGVEAHQIADYLGLCGDAVDNIPGVPGIGPKTAATLLAHFGSLDNVLERIDEIAYLRFRGAAQAGARLRQHREQALLSRQLATITTAAPFSQSSTHFAPAQGDSTLLWELCEDLNFGPMTRRRLHHCARLEFTPPDSSSLQA